jgi:hypothetical protein
MGAGSAPGVSGPAQTQQSVGIAEALPAQSNLTRIIGSLPVNVP